ncbi:MAG TPA: alpha/beta fold hydrolase [Alcanivorax sp.]|nr:alpha/beta fold hydrolase [Alcanivorax sp.]
MPTTWILLRGLVREQAHWHGFADTLAGALGGEQRVMCIDLPGNGQSHRDPSPTRVAVMVDAARAALSEQDVDGPVRLVALSLGGMVAMNWLSRYPDQVEAAALINSSAAPVSPFWRRLKPANYLDIVRHGLLGRDRLIRERMILEITTNRLDAADKDRIARQFADIDAARPVSAANTVRQLWAAARFRAPASLPAGRPVLVISAAGDRLVDPRCSAALAERWSAQRAVHPDGGHDLSLDDPDWLARTLVVWGAERPSTH